MVSIVSLWLPILLSAVLVFGASTIIHMVLRYHWNDFAALPDEPALAEAFRKAKAGPGNYVIPRCASFAEMREPAVLEKFEKGPVGFVTLLPPGRPSMGKNLVQWFVYSLAVGVFAAYLTSRTLAPGEDYLQVFRVSGTAAFLAYSGAEPVASVWKGVKWGTTLKQVLDGLIYALVTAGAFGWLWPR
jgi:hypothetical protein